MSGNHDEEIAVLKSIEKGVLLLVHGEQYTSSLQEKTMSKNREFLD